MPFIPVANTVQIQCEGTVDGQLTINDLYFEVSGGGVTLVNLTAIATAVAGWFGGTLAPLLSDDWATVRVIGTDLTSSVGPRVDIPAVTIGGVSGEANPNNVAAVVSFGTGSRGRSARGRNFVPAIPGAAVTLNTIDPAFIGDLLNAYLALEGPGTFLAGWQWVVVSRFTGGAPRVAGVTLPVISVTMNGNSVRSMRSREVGHGI